MSFLPAEPIEGVVRRLNLCGVKFMTKPDDALPILTFASGRELRVWLEAHHATSSGVWVRVFKKGSGLPSVTFDELLDEGLCFGWSESLRRSYDSISYLQRFTPRRTHGTQSARNQERVRKLVEEGRMTPAGLKALQPT